MTESLSTTTDLTDQGSSRALVEDLEDLAAFDERADEPSLRFDEVVEDLKRQGKV